MLRKILRSSKKDSKKSKKPFGISHGVYKSLNAVLPVILLLLIRAGLVEIAIVIALFSKWRVIAVNPRHLFANIRSNSVDIIVKLSTLSFMVQSNDVVSEQLAWTAWYILWLVVIKPGSSKVWVSLQATAAHIVGISALLFYSNTLPDVFTILGVWFIGVSAAWHFLSSYEEPRSHVLSAGWGFFTAQLAWVLGKWSLVYLFIPQIVFVILVTSYTIASMYNAHKAGTLKSGHVRQQVLVATVVLAVIVVLGDWGGNV